ncbi:hypothetical protein [Pseudolactococcus insecticola]|uniref:Uncharacterized protein n=1 Tax=Pseudolactococcus insecticola TaxID=2709158 RepID=A0A6A0B823_9LACT|nr:hypothetical protein [Lactococcus insecticola]GFH40813.1 hypothetical protein Hs20B_12110 [Lactococcus insecticola]
MIKFNGKTYLNEVVMMYALKIERNKDILIKAVARETYDFFGFKSAFDDLGQHDFIEEYGFDFMSKKVLDEATKRIYEAIVDSKIEDVSDSYIYEYLYQARLDS